MPSPVEGEAGEGAVSSRLSTGSIMSSPDHQYAVQHVEEVSSPTADVDFATSVINGAWDVDQAPYAAFTPLPPSPVSPPLREPSPPRAEPTSSTVDPSSADFDWATHRQPPQTTPIVSPTPTTSAPPEHHYVAAPKDCTRTQSNPPPIVLQPAPAPPRPGSVREGKEKKSGWARLGLSVRSGADDDDGAGKRKKSKGKEVEKLLEVERDREKEKESGFFGGLFGGGKRKGEQEQQPQPLPSPPPPEARMSPPPPTASGVLMPNGVYTNFYRLPIHVERAIYRLSHIKLANPRRPLYEQVLISNLMCVPFSSRSCRALADDLGSAGSGTFPSSTSLRRRYLPPLPSPSPALATSSSTSRPRTELPRTPARTKWGTLLPIANANSVRRQKSRRSVQDSASPLVSQGGRRRCRFVNPISSSRIAS